MNKNREEFTSKLSSLSPRVAGTFMYTIGLVGAAMFALLSASQQVRVAGPSISDS